MAGSDVDVDVMAGSDVVLVGRVQEIGSVCNVVEIVQHSQWC